MITNFPITTLPTNTPNLQPPVILSNLQNDVEYTVTIIAHLADGTTITESRKVTPRAGSKPAPPVPLTMNGLGLSGTGAPGSIVRLYDDNGDLVAEVEVDSSGNWSIPASMFPGGTTNGFSGSLTITDINGNISNPTPINSIDSIPPANPVTGSITGAGMTGTAEPGSTVYLLDANGNVITSVIVDSNGNWTIPASSFPGGVVSPFTGSIKVVDPAGNESGSVSLNILIDTTPPVQPITTTQNATGLSGIAEPGSTVNLYDSNGNLVASVIADSSGNWSIPASSFPGGVTDGFNGSIVSVDPTGNISAPTVILTMDGMAPSAPIITIANASKLSGTAEANTIIKLYDTSNALISTTVVDALGNWTFTPDKFPGGITDGFTGTLTSTDLAGNVSVATPVPIIDGLAPNPPIITVANASGLYGTAEPLAVIRMYNSFGILVAGTTADNLGNWSILPNQFPGNVINGYTGYLTQSDIAGNTSNQTVIAAIDATIPTHPAYQTANYYGISGTAEAGSRISLKDSNGVEVAFTFTDMNGNWSIPANSFPGQATNGFTGSITATDLAGNESSATLIPTINGVLPVTNLTTYTDDVGSIQSTTSTAPTTDDTKPGMNIGTGITDTPKLYIDNVLTSATYDSVAGTLTPNVPLADGSYNFTYTLTDSIGNISLPSAALSIAVDTTKPATPVAPTTYSDYVGSVQSATSNALTTDDTTPGINIGTGLTDVVKLYIDNALVTSTYDSVAGTLTPNTPLIHGTYSFSYTLTDAAGNESDKSASFVIMIDLLAPATPIAPTTYVDNVGSVTSNTSVAPETDDTTPGINIGSGLTDAPQLYVDGILTASTYNSVDGTLTPNSALSQGIKVITYTLTDAAGNESGQSPGITITINTTPPTTTNITSYVDNVGSVQSTTSVAVSTDDTTPGINIGTGLTTIPKLYIGGVLTAATYNSSVGTLTPNTPLSQGTYSFTYTLTDVVGNESLQSAAFSITIDTNSPTTPASAPLSYNDNVGNIQSATSTAIITDDTTPGINVGAGLTDTVNLYINGSLIVSVYNAITGTLTPFYPLAEGTYAFSYTLSDSVGNESGQSPSITITIDITPPTTPVSKPSSYIDNVGSIQRITSNDAITDDATPGINIGAGLTNTPKLYVNGIFTAATYVSGTGIITPNSPLSDGLKTITYTLSDVAGNESGHSPDITFTIDTVAPLVSTLTSYNDNVGIIQSTTNSSGYTDDTTPGINIGTGIVDNIRLYINGVQTAATYNSGTGTLTPNIPLADGSYQFRYSLTDVAGNESLSSILPLIIDTQPPPKPAVIPYYVDNVGVGPGSITSNSSTETATDDTKPGFDISSWMNYYSGKLYDLNSQFIGYSYTARLYVDGNLVDSTFDKLTGILSPTNALSEGLRSITYKALDEAGNISPMSDPLLLTIDITPPTTPPMPLGYNNGNGLVSNESTTRNIIGIQIVTTNEPINSQNNYALYIDDQLVNGNYALDQDPTKTWITFTTTLSDGPHTFKYTVVDSVGNESAKSYDWSVINTNTANGTITATTSSVEDGQPVKFYVAYKRQTSPSWFLDSSIEYLATVSNNSASVTLSGSDLINRPYPLYGSGGLPVFYTIWAFVEDSFGNTGSFYPSAYFTVDLTPVISTVTLSWGDKLISAEKAIDGTVSVVTSNVIDGKTLTILLNGVTYTTPVMSNAATVTIPSADLTAMTPGTYVCQAKVENKPDPGYTSTTEYATFEVPAPPAAPSTAPDSYIDNVGAVTSNTSTESATDDPTPGINIGTVTDTPKLYANDIYVPATYTSGTITPTLPMSDGTYAFTYSLSDADGNESGKSPAINITINTGLPPATPASAPASYVDNVGSTTSNSSTAGTTDDTTPGINIGSVFGTPKLYANNIYVPATYSSGRLTPDTAMTPGIYAFTYTLSNLNGESGKSPAINISILPPAPTSYVDNTGSITNSASTASTTDETRPGINIGIVTGTPKLYANNTYVPATYSVDTLTPDTAMASGTYAFTYTLTNGGTESGKSPAINITIDTTATIATVVPSWGAELIYTEANSDGTVTVTTTGIENGRTVSVVINGVTYTGSVSSNSVIITIPSASLSVLTDLTTYYIEVSVSDIAGNTATNNTTSFTTNLVITPGQLVGGGYYAGDIVDGGVTYMLIVSPKASGESFLAWGDNLNSAPVATETLTNGVAATNATSTSTYPAALYCQNRTINGYSDWYLPARDELEILYRNLKPTTTANTIGNRPSTPTGGFGCDGLRYGVNPNSSPTGTAYGSSSPVQTTVTAFRSGGAEAFDVTYPYWSSTSQDVPASGYTSWWQNFDTGIQGHNGRHNPFKVRAVRRMPK
jgi:hypothetical protein